MQERLATLLAGAAPLIAPSVDAAVDMAEITRAELAGIEAAMCPNAIEYVVIGHAHNDHWGGPSVSFFEPDGLERWAETLRKCTREVLSQKRAQLHTVGVYR